MRFNIKINESQLNKLILSEDIETDYSKSISKIAPFNISPAATCEAMKLALASYDIPPLRVGQAGTLSFPGVGRSDGFKLESQQRFIQWYYDVILSPDSVSLRGKAFEGLIGGVFGGSVVNFEGTLDKTDVKVGSNNISIKFAEKFDPSKNQTLGGIMTGFKKQLDEDTTGVREKILELYPGRITGKTIRKIFIDLMTNSIFKDIGVEFIEKMLDRPETFEPITYFMFGNFATINEIDVYQYEKYDIIDHIIANVENFEFVNGAIGVKNLSGVTPRKVLIKFPQFVKSKRSVFSSNTRGLRLTTFDSFTNEPTLASRITKNIDGRDTTVAEVRRQKVNNNEDDNLDYDINYFIVQTLRVDDMGRNITLDKPLREEMINQAVLKDVGNLSRIDNRTPEQELLIKKLLDYSHLISKGLYLTKTKVSDKGREAAIRKLFGERGHSLNPLIIQNIRKRPGAFIKNVINIYGCDNSGLSKLETALNDIFNINIQLPMAQHCIAGNNPQPEAVQESVNKVLKTLNEAIEKKK
jgi:hypothetical protein